MLISPVMSTLTAVLLCATTEPVQIPQAIDFSRSPLAGIAQKMRAIRSLKVRMRQRKELAAFDEVINSEGTLTFERPRRLRMDLTGPGGTLLVINGDLMSIHYKALGRTDRTLLSKDPRSRAVAEHLFLLLEADPKPLSAIYTLTVQGEDPLRVELVPKSEALGAVIRSVRARFDARGFVAELRLNEAGGDTTLWTFDTPTINEPIDDAAFQITQDT